MAEEKVVRLNVGGVSYQTSLATLSKYPKSILAATSKLKKDENGSYFVDRDGELFRHILNYLRNGKLICSDETLSPLRDQLVAEAKFYQLEGLINQLSLQPKVFRESSIIASVNDENTLLSWMSDEPSDAKWGILYKATRDGFKPANFHKRCDGKSPTLVVIKSGENVFGGYADKPWSSPEGHAYDHQVSETSFIFSLKNPHGYPPEKMLPSPDPRSKETFVRGGVKSKADRGPAFGDFGNVIDLVALSGNSNRVGFAEIREGFRTKYEDKAYLNGGYGLFVVDDLEVFGLAK